MKINTLFKNIKAKFILQDENLEIENLFYDSRQKQINGLFFCLVGENTDGHIYAQNAEENGAVCVVTEKELKGIKNQIVVSSTRECLTKVASNFFGNPENELKKIAVVGTNGKTSSTYIIKSILEASEYNVGLIGTSGTIIKDKHIETELTTPDPIELFSLLAKMVEEECDFLVMEVSAHAIYHKKTEGIIFDTCIFTNFTQDHLDFFDTMENYKKTKLSFFSSKHIKSAVVNIDDEVGQEIFMKADVPVVTFGINNPSDVFAVNILKKINGTEYVINLFDEVFGVNTHLPGIFNVYNTLGGICACSLFGVSQEEIKIGLLKIKNVEGRFNVFSFGNNVQVVIDFAHTPDGIENILSSAKELSNGKLICVFGCGGNRDKSKRPQMGEISEKYADFTVITSDNPRFENPELILDDIEKGMKKGNHVKIIDRRNAINFALRLAKPFDTIVICGKGGEKYQDINGVKVPYNEEKVIEEEFSKIFMKINTKVR